MVVLSFTYFPIKTLRVSFIKDRRVRMTPFFFFISYANSLVLHSLPTEPQPWWRDARCALISRRCLLIFVIRSDCRWPTCTLALIENLQMRPSGFKKLPPQFSPKCHSQRSAQRSLNRDSERTIEVNFLIRSRDYAGDNNTWNSCENVWFGTKASLFNCKVSPCKGSRLFFHRFVIWMCSPQMNELYKCAI